MRQRGGCTVNRTKLIASNPSSSRLHNPGARWLEKHHHQHTELLVEFYKKDSGKPSITWPESVDGALCFGWIDDLSYSIRFTPRKTPSTWSVINIQRAR